jgi:hypothetical protein
MKALLLNIFTFFLCLHIVAQDSTPYLDYFHQNVEKSITQRRFSYDDIVSTIEKLRVKSGFKVEQVGKSVEGEPINLVCWGNGDQSILLWSQMHGDEPTATMALMDLFNFLSEEQDPEAELFKDKLRESLSLYFLPMLNPDGARSYKRHNAMGIDINRDALKLNTPEGQVLKAMQEKLQPDWGFNLHDQSRYYQAGHNPAPATFSFLAPAYNKAKDVNGVRLAAMQLIVEINKMIQEYIPGQVGRYNDTFEPRAFGDNMQKWGVRTILVECGGNPEDLEKQEIRKYHFALFLKAFKAISDESYKHYSISDYEEIPFNRRRMMELVIRNVNYKFDGFETNLDLGFQDIEYNSKTKDDFYKKGSISEIGDLTGYQGYQDLDMNGFRLKQGKLYPEVINSVNELTDTFIQKLHRRGYTDIRVRNIPVKLNRYDYPLMLHTTKKNYVNNSVRLYGNPSLYLEDQEGLVKGIIVNGVYYSVL